MKISKLKPIASLMQRSVLWLTDMTDLMLVECSKDKNFNLEELFPDACAPVQQNNTELEAYDVDMLD